MCVIALLFWLKTESNQATAASSMNGPIYWTYWTTTFVTSTLSQVTDRVYVCVCMYSVHSLLLWLYSTLYNEDELAAAAAVPVSGEIAAAARCQCVPQHYFRFCVKMFSVPCVLCPLHWLTSGKLELDDQWSCTGVFQITDEVMTTIGDISETPTVTR